MGKKEVVPPGGHHLEERHHNLKTLQCASIGRGKVTRRPKRRPGMDRSPFLRVASVVRHSFLVVQGWLDRGRHEGRATTPAKQASTGITQHARFSAPSPTEISAEARCRLTAAASRPHRHLRGTYQELRGLLVVVVVRLVPSPFLPPFILAKPRPSYPPETPAKGVLVQWPRHVVSALQCLTDGDSGERASASPGHKGRRRPGTWDGCWESVPVVFFSDEDGERASFC